MIRAINIKAIVATFFVFLSIPQSHAGVALGATRVIYPAEQKQVQLAVTNNDDKGNYLIQSWIENAEGKKDNRFVITPPLFSMMGKKENTLRIIDSSNDTLPKDRESLFWINVKAIPALDKAKENENYLQFAIVSRIKLYYRPKGLAIAPEQASEKLRFSIQKDKLVLNNPTPYYLTVTDLKIDGKALEHTIVPPMGKTSVSIPSGVGAGGDITYKTINDYGAITSARKGLIE
ncbi:MULTISPECIES: fimbria/pilus periplasmic chaperone [Serratia]|uniref:fimbria/pilus periplasmic chaperone n=1 Tax=Serratia TaxID=613 RepID=UPI00020E9300|nr:MULTISPECIES: fimbria/pilus periplasmic chaperone [Serratia]AEF44256.1 Pili assembly chaperone [Serratia plymuthica AS9]AEF49208.1 Pili assembly chaperone [Serratia sp. AS12]AEG26915.1 Pili assembly chaperone [Serratia sp. AS13]QPS54955.1 fimbria/pilus periplasmic chaperone [Serratia plymuthica]UTN97783.1 fimbria/pilus periplasmic chaperone [Serratia plymuthica]